MSRIRLSFGALVAFIPRLWSNWITLLGTVVVSVAGATVLTALAIDLTSSGLNAYAAALLFLIMPGFLLLGLLLIPLGLLRERRRARRHGGAKNVNPVDDVEQAIARAMNSPTVRRRVAFVLLMTGINVLLFSTVTYRAVTFMETPKFCGATCHTVMQPEYDAHKDSPHSRVACVSCHIGDGAPSAVQAKLNGLHQVWGVLTGRYHRPIDTPVHNLRSASETCGSCHQPSADKGPRLAFRVHFKDDEANTPQVTAMMFNLGGRNPRTGAAGGIHAHAGAGSEIRFEVMDDKRQVVGKIQKVEGGKVVKEWLPPKGQAGAARELRTMDCVDCHNRATHAYDGAPATAVEKALADGRLDRTVPWLRQVAADVLATSAPPRAEAAARFREALEASYTRAHPTQKPAAASLDAAAGTLTALYLRNVYPQMNLTWNQYPTLIGHGGPDPGKSKAQCFRCHDGDHRTADGQELSSKCESCHEIVAKDELPQDLPDELRPLLRL